MFRGAFLKMEQLKKKQKNRHPVRRILHAFGLGGAPIASESRADAIIPGGASERLSASDVF